MQTRTITGFIIAATVLIGGTYYYQNTVDTEGVEPVAAPTEFNLSITATCGDKNTVKITPAERLAIFPEKDFTVNDIITEIANPTRAEYHEALTQLKTEAETLVAGIEPCPTPEPVVEEVVE